MADKKKCGEFIQRKITGSSGWPSSLCGKPAKFICHVPFQGFGSLERKQYRCGIHAKRYEKIEEIKNG